MSLHAIIFSLNEKQCIFIPFKEPLTYVGWNYAEPIHFSCNNHIITIANRPTYFNIRDLRDRLKKVLNNELQQKNHLLSDLGLIFNEYYFKSSSLTIKQLQQQDDEPLEIEIYRLWEAYENEKKHITWLYNDHNNNIILEITPSYSYFYCDKKEEPNYISYKKWIKSYQPYFKNIIPRVIAQQWLEQAEYIVKTVDENVIRWKKEQELKK